MSRVQILMYHQVGDFDPMRTHRATFCHYRRFRSQMRLLHRLGYTVISLEDAIRGAGGRGLPSRPVVLTFDDGYRNFLEYAFPVLREYGYPATLFLLAGKIGGRADWLVQDGYEAAPLLDEGDLRVLMAGRVEFGSHGAQHVRLAGLSEEELKREIVGSKTALETLLGRSVRYFCYPYGTFDGRAVESVRNAGYEAAVSCRRGAFSEGEDPFLLPRKAVSFGDSALGLWWKLLTRNTPTEVVFK